MKLSLNYRVMIHTSHKGYVVTNNGQVYFKNRKRSLCLDTRGYYSFTIRFKTKKKDIFRRVWVHKLQAYQKYGNAIFIKGIQVRHLDGNCKNNSWDNILIGSQSQNSMDKPIATRRRVAIIASSKIRAFSDDKIKQIREDRNSGMTYMELIQKYKTSKGTLSYLFNKALYFKAPPKEENIVDKK